VGNNTKRAGEKNGASRSAKGAGGNIVGKEKKRISGGGGKAWGGGGRTSVGEGIALGGGQSGWKVVPLSA